MQDSSGGSVVLSIKFTRAHFRITNGHGIGDLPGIIRRLNHVVTLGIDAIRISPIYSSPIADFGFDVTDYCNVAGVFGNLADLDRLVAEAHRRGLRLIPDFVPNYTSNEHPRFIESRSLRANPKRDWHIWREMPVAEGRRALSRLNKRNRTS